MESKAQKAHQAPDQGQKGKNNNETWEVSGNEIDKTIGINSYFTPSLSYGLGKVFGSKSKTPITIYTRANLNTYFNYNTSIVFQNSIELGARWNVNWGIKRGEVKRKVKTKMKKK